MLPVVQVEEGELLSLYVFSNMLLLRLAGVRGVCGALFAHWVCESSVNLLKL